MSLVGANVAEGPSASIFKVLKVSYAFKMEAVGCSGTLVLISITACRDIQEIVYSSLQEARTCRLGCDHCASIGTRPQSAIMCE